MNQDELDAMRALGECVSATGKALAKLTNVLAREVPKLTLSLSEIMEELVRDLSAAALLLPQTEQGPT